MSDFIFGPEHIGQEVVCLPHRLNRGIVKEIDPDESKVYRLGIDFFTQNSDGSRKYWPTILFPINGKSQSDPTIFLELNQPKDDE